MRSGQLFTDPKFDYNLDSLGEKIEWARPQEICSEPKLVVEGTDQFDVIQVNNDNNNDDYDDYDDNDDDDDDDNDDNDDDDYCEGKAG